MYVYCRFRGNDHFFPMTRRSGALPSLPRLLFLLLLRLQLNFSVGIAAGDDQAQDTSPSDSTCQLYMAQSTIPNAGIGVFTAVPLNKGERVGYPDTAIPVTDLDWHNNGRMSQSDYHWLWKQYDWLAEEIGKLEYESEIASACVPGMGAMPNCHFRLSNVEESWSRYSTAGLHRSKDPGAGAFTGYHGRITTASKDLREGSEIFVNYGEHWFRSREDEFGLIPVSKSYIYASRFLEKYRRLKAIQVGSWWSFATDNSKEIKQDLWDMIKNFPYKSRGLAALPHTYETADRATEVGIKETELESSMRSVEWLHENGKCLDNLRPNASTIPQAGRGAFATRFIPKGNVVAPAPLIHIPFKETLLMYGVLDGEDTEIRNSSDVIGKQLLLNYCFGHASSTLLLCPYGSGTAYINHNHQQPNAKIAWPDEKHSLIHKAAWLNKSINFLEDQFTTGLEFDFVATKDIHPGEEVFIDYGSEWEVAWNKHVNDWAPKKSAPKFEDASKWNCFDEDCNDAAPLRTEVEQRVVPYAKNLEILCFFNYDDERILVWKEYDDWRKNNHSVKKFPCTILQRYHAEDGSFLYTVKLELPFTKEEEDNEGDLKYEMEEKFVIVKDLPQFAIQFINSQYKSDLFLRNAFRHELMIPDNMMPSSWKNLNPENGS